VGETAPIAVVGLGPAGLDRLAGQGRQLALDPGRRLVLRTLQHPAAAELAAGRDALSCDDLYETAAGFDELYAAIASRVVTLAAGTPVTYAVPGSAAVGERAVAAIRTGAATAGLEMVVHPGESFLDLVWVRTGCDPIAAGVQVLDGRALPDPLPLHLPTVVTQVDRREVLGDVAVALGRTLDGDTSVIVLDRLGSDDEVVVTVPLRELARYQPGPRTTLYLSPPPTGWYGLVTTNRRLRRECPWDREQTHHTLLPHLVEETYETVEAISRLDAAAPRGEPDLGSYAQLEEELGDLLLQVVFHATLAEEPGAFGVEEVAEGIRRKLVQRHPHVFGDVIAEDAATVSANWERIKATEKVRESLMDGVPQAMPAQARAEALQRRAATVGFDWNEAAPVLDKLREEVDELAADIADPEGATHELGDVLFTVVNLARHLGIDPELSFRRANDRFADRFRTMERLAAAEGEALDGMSLEQLDALWALTKG